ncbi:hypothetical protein FHETE_6413 [Fusarium heterosporum]|uniref:BZIP domain-containing protein n=1 Tax=Fusarium heterosporum TaxID=42747 RepID=A0A8H5TBJ4_FUSHE|nr:hypothetical protein FHETE_6413 [Fusarium heterosporum]
MSEAITVLPNRPRTRQRAYKQPPSLDVPDIDQDAAERKRVLNVLAQRRYREKKRLNRLKAKSDAQSSDDKPESPISQTKTAQISDSQVSSDDVFELPILDRDTQGVDSFSNTSFSTMTAGADILAGLDLSIASWSPLPDMTLPLPLLEENSRDETLSGAYNDLATDFGGCDLAMMIGTASFSNSPSSSTESFPDSYHLPVLQITLFKAVMRIADRLNCNEGLWELSGNSAFNTGTGTPASLLPPAWQPTQSQIAIPHHPVFDLLPWPSVRERVIFITSLPDESRPPRAQGSLACVNFTYDLEDTSEGVRIYGDDPYNPENWELGQLVFERWWWLFDSAIIATSNRWRRARGAPPLLLKSGSANPSPNSSSSPGISVSS